MSLKQHGRRVKQQGSNRTRRPRQAAVCALAAAMGLCASHPLRAAAQQYPQQPSPGQSFQVQPPQDVPALRHRSANNTDEAATPAVASGHTSLWASAEGEYPWKSWRGDGEIELYFDGGTLHGYMTEPLDAHSQTASPLVFDFATTHIEGDALRYTTRRLHGAWYSFIGHLERGLVASPSQPGYYLLTGTLTEHGGETGGGSHTVSLPREPGDN
jgi:hypothetical protein